MRYRATGQLDDPPVKDGDELWDGVISASDPSIIKKGKLAAGVNVRLDRGPAETRKGHGTMMTDAQRDSILGFPPVDLFDASPYRQSAANDIPDNMDAALVATSGGNAFLWERTTSGPRVSSIPYSPYHQSVSLGRSVDAIRAPLLITKAHLQETISPTLLFSNKGPVLPFTITTAILPLASLPFTLGATFLGNPVLRYRGADTDQLEVASVSLGAGFKQFKEVVVTAADPDTQTVTTAKVPEFSVGEMVHIQTETPYTGEKSTWTGDWTVAGVSGTSFTVEEPTVSIAALPSGFNSVYSMEDQCPPAEFAAWAGNRLFVPIGPADMMISDPLSTHVFPVLNRLQIAREESGGITALVPMGDDALLVFKTHSIHLIQDVSDNSNYDPGTDDQLKITRITNQLGCSSRKTVQVVGDEVLFFSPHGLYGLALNAKGQGAVGLPPQAVRVADFPLSRDVDDVIDGVDFTYAEDFTATFNRGRYYLQVKMTSGEWRVLVYNTLLKGWEGHDTADSSLQKLFSMSDEGKARLIALSTDGALVRWEDTEDGRDYYGESQSTAYESSITTREYDMGTGGINRFRRIVSSWDPLPTDPMTGVEIGIKVTGSVFNPDTDTFIIYEAVDQAAILPVALPFLLRTPDDHYRRDSIRKRGEKISFTITNNSKGRMKFKSVQVEGTTAHRQTINYE